MLCYLSESRVLWASVREAAMVAARDLVKGPVSTWLSQVQLQVAQTAQPPEGPGLLFVACLASAECLKEPAMSPFRAILN